MGRSGGRFVLTQVVVVAAGLALGVGAIAVSQSRSRPAYHPGTPSVRTFPFATVPPVGPAQNSGPAPALAAEPADAPAAVRAFLQALADGRPADAYVLLDAAAHTRYSTAEAWVRAQVDRPQPVTFDIVSSQPSLGVPGGVAVDVAATHHPSLDSIRGLVPARSRSTWLARQEAGAWRVAADPVSFLPVLPADAGATDVVQRWVSDMAVCDAAGAGALQVAPYLYGPAALAQAPCQRKGTWTAGVAGGLDRTPAPEAFLAAFGADVTTWARLVPVSGPGGGFLAAVAPMGDGWQVMGVAVAQQ